MPGTLYLAATPIGNLEDITLRVLKCLENADLIAAEDTRNSLRLLNHYNIKTPLTSYHEFNKFSKADELVKLLLEGKNIALITDAGTPCISDPGEELVKRAVENNINVTSLPGPSAFTTALTLSALQTKRFSFLAFLPAEKNDRKERKRLLSEISTETKTIILYEAPHRLKETLKDLNSVLGSERRISIIKELTKLHENAFRTTVGEAVSYYEKNEPRGEYVLVIEGKSLEDIKKEKEDLFLQMPLEEHVKSYMEKGFSEKDAMKLAAKDRGISKKDVYQALKIL